MIAQISIPPITHGKPLRELGPTEDIYYRFDSISPLYFGVTTRFSGPLNAENLRSAWDAVRARHPLLRSRIVLNSNGVPWFVTSEKDMILEIRKGAPDEAWSVLEGSLISRFDTENGPLVRCVILDHGDNDFSMVTTYHHAISDGRSATFIIRDFLTSLAQMARGGPPDLEPLPLMEYYGNRMYSVEYKELKSFAGCKRIVSTFFETCFSVLTFLRRGGMPHGPKRSKNVPLAKQTLLIEPRTVRPDNLRVMLKRAKDEGVTVQCLLNAALSLTVAEDIPFSQFRSTACTQVLDIRKRLNPPVGEDCGFFVAGSTSLHRIGRRTKFWKLTREIHRGLKDAIETPMPFFQPNLHNLYADIGQSFGHQHAQAFSKVISQLHAEGLCVSNLGRVKIEVADSPLIVTGVAFATNTNVLNSFNTSAASCDGQLVWSFSGSSVYGREKIAQVADRTIEILLENTLTPDQK